MEKFSYKLSDFSFELPEHLIAQYPTDYRDRSRLLSLNKSSGQCAHYNFYQLPDLLKPGDLMVFNNARVINVRIYFRRKTGGKVEIILIQKKSDRIWSAISNRTSRLSSGDILTSVLDSSVKLKITCRKDNIFQVESNLPLTDELLTKIGEVPLPPYIKRNYQENDRERYQTVYACKPGSAASPTAGLHFTPELLTILKEREIESVFLTLNVSWGTFQPVRSENLDEHIMHTETFILPEASSKIINKSRSEGRRIVSVGTTSARVLEATYRNGKNISGEGETNIFIYPPYKIKSFDGLITNFHTPESTLLMLVSAFTGHEKLMNAYREAIKMEYRFFSYGDSMLII